MIYEPTDKGIKIITELEDWEMLKVYLTECKLNLIFQLGIITK